MQQSEILTRIIKDEGENKNKQTKGIKLFKLRKETNYYERDKLRCLTSEFKDGCSQRMCLASLIFNRMLVEAELRILKQSFLNKGSDNFQNLPGA